MPKQTSNDLMNHLNEQIGFLQRSCELFDNGYKSESKRIALVIRVLLHDTNNSVSLLKQIGKKNILFYDTSDYNPENLMQKLGIVKLRMTSQRVEFLPLLDDGPFINPEKEKITFDDWWNGVVFVDVKRNTITRKKLILDISNQDGGAHIDPTINKVYAGLTRDNSLGVFEHYDFNGVKTEATNPEWAGVRQIAHEVLKSLSDEFPEYF